MRLIGYCTECHRIRRVAVRNYLSGQTVVGVCAECEAKADELFALERQLFDAEYGQAD